MSLKNSFGFETVSPEERTQRIRRVFSKVASRYDLMNDAMSMGIHRLWKNRFAKMVNVGEKGVILDLAGGTGDIANRLAGAQNTVLIADPSVEMMQAGRTNHSLPCIASSAEQLSMADNSCDCVTLSFGIRNVTDVSQALKEIHRVLKPGGQCLILEFSTPAPWLKPYYDLYSFHVIPRLGAMIAREPEAYQYLVESIRKFPDQQAFAGMMATAGFDGISFRNLSFGIACIHQGTKAVPKETA